MRSTSPRFTLLAIAALATVAVRPAGAQAVAAAPVRPAVGHAPAAFPRAVAIYRFTTPRLAGIPTQVTVSDSAGQLVASFRLPGSNSSHPMLALVVGDELVLQGETPRGVLTLQLAGQQESQPAAVIGRWRLEDQEGELRGRVRR